MLTVDVNILVDDTSLPDTHKLTLWAKAAYLNNDDTELALSIISNDYMAELNHQFREKNTPTNVLSFPAETAATNGVIHLGDIVLCAPVIIKEATEQHKSLESHWAHMVVHGMLHLQAYDHTDENDAQTMETLEINILQSLGFSNPYT